MAQLSAGSSASHPSELSPLESQSQAVNQNLLNLLNLFFDHQTY